MLDQGKIHEFSGSHYEMGFQQGTLFQDLVQDALRVFKKLEDIQLMKPRFMPMCLFLWIASRRAKNWLKPLIKSHAPNQAERIRGMADGSGMSERLLYFFSAAELMLAKLDWELPHLETGCTSIAYGSAFTSRHHAMISRNFDYARFIVRFLMLRENAPDGHYKTFDLTAFPLPGTFNGLNEHGVFIATDEAFPVSEIEDGLSASLIIQEALEKCASTEQVVQFFKNAPRGSGNVVLVADPSDDIRVLEYTSKQFHVREPDQGRNFIVATNHYASKELKSVDLPRGAVFGNKSPRGLRGILINETSYVRKERAESLLSSTKKVDVDFLQELHRDHGSESPEKGGMNSICHHDPINVSAASMIVDLKSFDAWICFGLPCENKYEKFNFKGS